METASAASGVGRVTIDIALANNRDVQMAACGELPADRIRRVTANAIVDSRAMHMVLPGRLVEQLGLPIGGEVVVRFADQCEESRQIAREAQVELFGRTGTYRAIVEPNRDTVLLGAIVLGDLDLLVDRARQELRPRDPRHIIAEIESVI